MKNLQNLQSKLIENNFDAYIIPTSDFHNSEYISDFFKTREYLTGFTGSAGTLIVSQNSAYLFVDGRYYIQAEKETEGKDIQILKLGKPDTPSLIEFIKTNPEIWTNIAFDGRLFSAKFVTELIDAISDTVTVNPDSDLIRSIWKNRPKMPFSLLYESNIYYSGKTYKKKLEAIRNEMDKINADVHIISSLEDQAWLYNLRGNDVSYNPVFLAFTIITPTSNILFVDSDKLTPPIENLLKENEIIVKPYFAIYNYIKDFKNKNILVNLDKINYQIYNNIAGNNNIINQEDPSTLMKCIKNPTEIRNIKNVHVKDGIAFVKFMRYVKDRYEKGADLSEISLSDKIYDLRKKNKGFIDLSFNTICAFNDHAAMMHYSATTKTNAKIDKAGIILVDSGGHYLGGSTDITRCIAVGKINDTIKTHFTTVLKSLIALSNAVFIKGCTGQHLDVLARGPIWKLLLDYKCGTGHGIGNLLSIHEGPNAFRWTRPSAVIEAGMITTCEPGIYIEGKHGIRIENELLCVEAGNSEFGEFLKFEPITYAPIDLDAIKVSLLTKEEKEWLNGYHQLVYDTLSPDLNETEKEWLNNYTRKI